MKPLRILLVEPDYRRVVPKSARLANPAAKPPRSDDGLWYPPLGLMKLARFHKQRGDTVHFVRGCDSSVFQPGKLFPVPEIWDRVYITTLFTFHFDKIVSTIKFYRDAVGGTANRLYVGGIMASLMADDIFAATGIFPRRGILASPGDIGLTDKINIDRLPPDYTILDRNLYAINDTHYAYTTRGCPNKCAWCGVPTIEPEYVPYIDIKPAILAQRKEDTARGEDRSTLLLMDNNVLASPQLPRIIEDLLALGYARGDVTDTDPPKQRVVDFNQGLDADHVTEANMQLLSRINLKPMRIAFDRATERNKYEKAVQLARNYGVEEFSNYMLYNFRDTPRDLYDRLVVNISLNEGMVSEDPDRKTGRIFSYPMRFAPIYEMQGAHENRQRDYIWPDTDKNRDWLANPAWTPRFIRNIEIMKGAAHGTISPVPTLAWRAVGRTFQEFLINLYMPEEFLRNRDAHERTVYEYHKRTSRRGQGNQKPTGMIEKFRRFMSDLLREQDARFYEFHAAVTPNTIDAVRIALNTGQYKKELAPWLMWYERKPDPRGSLPL